MELTLRSYKPTTTLSYHSPGTRRFFTIKAKRLVRLARRDHDGRLFLPEIVTLIQEAARELLHLGGLLLLTDKGQMLLSDLSWILSPHFAPSGLTWDVREKQRHAAPPRSTAPSAGSSSPGRPRSYGGAGCRSSGSRPPSASNASPRRPHAGVGGSYRI